MEKSGRLFILGAGFSAGAKVPTCPELLKRVIDLYKIELPSRYIDLKIIIESVMRLKLPDDLHKVNLAELCTFFDYSNLTSEGMNNHRYTDIGMPRDFRAEIFKYYLAKAVVQSVPRTRKLPRMYIQFAKLLTDQDMVCTFNWDCIVEASIHHVGKEYTYSVFPLYEYKNMIPVNKLHGSINWRVGDLLSNKKGWIRSCIDIDERLDLFYRDKEIEPRFWLKSYEGFDPPFMVLPGFGKAYDVRVVAPLWSALDYAFYDKRKIYIIGLSMADDDFFIRQMWRNCLKFLSQSELVIINPDPSVKKAFSFFEGTCNVKFVQDYLSLDIIKAIEAGDL